MNKKEILEKYKASKPKDEGIEYIDNKANKWGVKGILSILSIVIYIILLVALEIWAFYQ